MASPKKKAATKNETAAAAPFGKKEVAIVGLAAIIAATQSEAGFTFVGEDEASELVKEGFVETNSEIRDAEGRVATRATQKGIDSMSKTNETSTANAGGYEIESDIPLPAPSARGRISETYPFAALGVGQSFFVPKDAKKLGSTVSSANARYSEEVQGETRTNRKGRVVPVKRSLRKFVVKPAQKNGVDGARIFRVQ